MRPRFTMAIIVAAALGVASAGAAAAMTTDSDGLGPVGKLLPPLKPSPTPLQPIKQIVQDDGAPGSVGSGTTDPDGGSTDGNQKSSGQKGGDRPDASATSAGGSIWSMPYAGWRRFFDLGEGPFASQVSYLTSTRTVPAPAGSQRVATVTPVSSRAPQMPPYLWALLPLGLLVLWAAAFAVFEPLRQPSGPTVLVRSVRRTARDLPAGMTRTAARTAVRALRGFGRWRRK